VNRGVLAVAAAAAAISLSAPAPAAVDALSIDVSANATIYRYVTVHVSGQADARSRVSVIRDRLACSPDGFQEESLAVAQDAKGPYSSRAEVIGGSAASGPFSFTTHYLPHRFGVDEHICAYVIGDDGRTAATADRVIHPGFRLPDRTIWGGAVASGLVSIATVRSMRLLPGHPFRTQPGHVLIVGDCAHRGGQSGRRWYVPNLPVTQAGTFHFHGRPVPDNTRNYDAPIPAPWPTQNLSVTLDGRFQMTDRGLTEAVGTVRVNAGSAHCRTRRFHARGDPQDPGVPRS
jgi:hypothetical protein